MFGDWKKEQKFKFWYQVEISNRHSSEHVKVAIIYKMCGVQVRGQGYRYMVRKQQIIEAI